MYTNIRACLCINGSYDQVFLMQKGVFWGCLVRPLMFSLYMNCWEVFVELELFIHLIATKKYVIWMAGILLPILLFLDDILFMTSDVKVV